MKKLYRSIATVVTLCSGVLAARPDFDINKVSAALIADHKYDLVQEEIEFYAMHRKHTQGVTLQELGLTEQTLNEKLMAVFNKTRQDFNEDRLELVVVKNGDELLGSVFFCRVEDESGSYIRIRHLNSPHIDQFEIFAQIFEKMLPLIHQCFPSVRQIFCVTRTAIQVYKDALQAVGFTESSFLPEECDCNSQVAYFFYKGDNL